MGGVNCQSKTAPWSGFNLWIRRSLVHSYRRSSSAAAPSGLSGSVACGWCTLVSLFQRELNWKFSIAINWKWRMLWYNSRFRMEFPPDAGAKLPKKDPQNTSDSCSRRCMKVKTYWTSETRASADVSQRTLTVLKQWAGVKCLRGGEGVEQRDQL